MRYLIVVLSIVFADVLRVHLYGMPKTPLEVFLTLLCVLVVASLSTIVASAICDSKGRESFSGMENAIFNYGLGTTILSMALPVLSIYLEEFKWVTFSGVWIILLATVWFNYIAARVSAAPKW